MQIYSARDEVFYRLSSEVQVDTSENSSGIHLHLIRTPEESRGQGLAERALQDLLDKADREGKTVTLTPEPLFGDTSTSKNKLIQWYKSHGFIDNKGRNTDYEISDSMYRLPKGG